MQQEAVMKQSLQRLCNFQQSHYEFYTQKVCPEASVLILCKCFLKIPLISSCDDSGELGK